MLNLLGGVAGSTPTIKGSRRGHTHTVCLSISIEANRFVEMNELGQAGSDNVLA